MNYKTLNFVIVVYRGSIVTVLCVRASMLNIIVKIVNLSLLTVNVVA